MLELSANSNTVNSFFTLFSAVAQLERDIIIKRTLAGRESARRRGAKIGRKRGLGKEAQKKAILAESYYRDENKQLSIAEIMKLLDIKSKPTLYKYSAHQGRRNCSVCMKLFWDKEQPLDEACCEKHFGN